MNDGESRPDRGASSVEYGLLLAGIAAVLAVAVWALGGMTGSTYEHTCQEFDNQVSISASC